MMASDLHEAILANSLPIVQMLLRQGADPNISPLIAPIGIVDANSSQEKARNLHRTLGRVFRSKREGTIQPLTVAVCNTYHHTSVGKESALSIVQALLDAGADVSETCCGVAFCNIGTYPSVTVNSQKTAAKVALFLKRFPPTENADNFETAMDQVAALLHEKDDSISQSSTSPNNNTTALRTWTPLLHDEASCSDFQFICPDGQVKAHQCVLQTAAPFFRGKSDKGEFKTTHSVSVIKAILEFLYIGQCNLDTTSSNERAKLLLAACEFQLEPLVDRVVRGMIANLNSPESVKEALLLSQYNASLIHLKTACLDYIENNSTMFLVDPSFLSLSKDHPVLWNELKDALLEQENTSGKRRKLGSGLSEYSGAFLVPDEEDTKL